MKDIFVKSRQHLMTGVSYMIPFVVSGGILLTIGILLGGGKTVPGISQSIADIGIFAFNMMIPMMAGYMAYSISDRVGIAPGVVGGVVASSIGAGFIGGIIAGFIAGIVTEALKKIPMHPYLAALKPIIIIPVLGVGIVGGLMLIVGQPISALSQALEGWLRSLSGVNTALLGLIIGAMMASDMGGPINKIAFAFCAGMLNEGVYAPMAACWIGIMTPPIGLAVATKIAPKKFTLAEKKSAVPALVMGATGITEGAIPYAAADPIRVIPSIIVGSAVGGSLALLLGSQAPIPSGGIFVIPFFIKPLMFVVAFIVAIMVTALMAALLKKEVSEEENELLDDNVER